MKIRTSFGFTLIEVMITVAIIAILATVAYPSFVDQIRKSRRADAKTSLTSLRLEQEKWRANNPTYGPSSNVWIGTDSFEGYYTIAVLTSPAPTATTFTATATPKVGTDQANDSCGTFAVDQSGPNEAGAYADVIGCWR